jgi:hypothetical protein
MTIKANVLAVVLACVAAPVAAQNSAPVAVAPVAAPGAQVDPAALEAARALLKASGFDSQMERTARQSAVATFDTMMEALARQQGTTIPDDLKASVRAIMVEDVEGMIADMKLTALDQAAAIYARHFTADELRELERLQTNPVLVKFREIAPGFMTELGQIGVAAAAERLPALQAKLRAAVEEYKRTKTLPRAGRS